MIRPGPSNRNSHDYVWRWSDLWTPPYCVLCRRHYVRRRGDTASERMGLCPACRSALPRRVGVRSVVPTVDPRWIRTGAVDAADQSETCVALDYTEQVAYAIRALKFHGQTVLAGPLGQAVAEAVNAAVRTCRLRPPDVMVPLPLHPKRQRRRGYNQAALIAREAAGALGVGWDPGLLVRVRMTRPQSEVGDVGGRLSNVAGAFGVCEEGAARGRHILLVDDVLTTGATLTAALICVRAAGAASVFGAVIASNRQTEESIGGADR